MRSTAEILDQQDELAKRFEDHEPDPAKIERVAYSVKEARLALGIGETLIYDLLAQGRLRSVKAGRRILIPKSALEAFLEGE